jgi:hypothetical protein
MNDLFNWLQEDMRCMINWDEEERQEPSEKHCMGFLWLNRGLLALRVGRKPLGERALRNVVEQGGSLLAWKYLLQFYTEKQSLNSTLRVFIEVLEFLFSNDVVEMERVPYWLM